MTTKTKPAPKKPYVKPEVKSAKIYERLSLACNKASGPRCQAGVLNS